MAEYIERNKLGIGRCNPEVFENKGYADGWNAAIDIIQSAPAADVQEVPSVSRWEYKQRHRKSFRRYTGVDDYGEKHTITVKEEYEGLEPYCGKCGAQAAESWQNYCPKCGAKMDLEVTE